MKQLYKILLILFLVPIISSATEKTGKYTKKKVILKKFTVDTNATLNVTNKYGNIDVISWDKNTIEIEVTITTNGNDEEKVEQKLEQIGVDFNASSNYVSAKTNIEKNSSSWSFWGKSNNVNMEINYKIKIPITNNVDLTNDYGGISLDKLEGVSKIDCDYGSLTIGELLNSNNTITIDYTNKSEIDFMKDGTIDADYSTLHIGETGKVELTADYSTISFGKVSDLKFDCDYGSLKVGSAKNLNGVSDYMHTTVEKLDGSGSFSMDYGSLKINDLGSNIGQLKIESSYTQLKFGVNPNTAFNISATLSYGSFKCGNGFTFNKEIVKSSSKFYEGYYNSSNSKGNISIKSSYGSITFFNN